MRGEEENRFLDRCIWLENSLRSLAVFKQFEGAGKAGKPR